MRVSTFWLYPFIVVAGLLQALGPPMNAQLRIGLVNPWLATLVSFALIVGVFIIIAAMFPRPLPTAEAVAGMPWWAPLGGIVGAVAVVAGLLFVDKIGAGPFAAVTIGANLLASVAIDQLALVGMPLHLITVWRAIGVIVMIVGVVLIVRN